MAWDLTGSYVETCSCELMCPCNLSFDHGATYDFCRVTLVFNIQQGQVEGTVTEWSEVADAVGTFCQTWAGDIADAVPISK